MSPATGVEKYGFEHVKLSHIMHDLSFRQPVPARLPDFDLPTTDGAHLTATDIVETQPALLVTGSVTCPMTATSTPMLKRLHEQYGDRVTFFMLYVREAHPGDNFPQPRSMEEKLANARELQQRDAMPWPVIVDEIDGALHKALDEKPNAAYLIGANGEILFRALWASDGNLPAAVERVALGERPLERESQKRAGPMAQGMGKMRQLLHESGPRAERDIWRAAPPIALTAWTASIFRPLSPKQRTFAALGLLGLTAGALIALGVGARRRLRV